MRSDPDPDLVIGIWELAVLATLRETPMHPYQMQRLLEHRHKDKILVLKRGSLYHAIGRLERAALIEQTETSRNGRRPERTTYRLTPAGRQALMGTLKKIVATPRRESSEFMAAVSFLVHLTPAESLPFLKERAGLLQKEIERQRGILRDAGQHVDRINLIENEYLLAMLMAERQWVMRLAADVEDGSLTWNLEKMYAAIKAGTEEAGRLKESA